MTKIIGLMSGTSVDGIDAVLVEITGKQTDLKIELLNGKTYPYTEKVRSHILAVAQGASLSLPELAELDDAIAHEFASAALKINEGLPVAQLIGSHGQTVYHRPATKENLAYSLQLGRGAMIAQVTGITTISNFRQADIAVGGQGAPLLPCVDVYLFNHPKYSRCIQNIGGIGNVTYLPPKTIENITQVRGWDTGPGNTLLDLAIAHFTAGEKNYDADGNFARSGHICQELVNKWLEQDYFQKAPPKSTGRELFGQTYLQQCLDDANHYDLKPSDVMATLTELTAASIAYNYRQFLTKLPDQVLLCGGGSRNLYLKERIENLLAPCEVLTTSELGVDADFKEAIAFTVFAYWRDLGIPANLLQVTGAKQKVLLGDVFPAIR
jgi:anhydro-N-acetylmuramic acid kinase